VSRRSRLVEIPAHITLVTTNRYQGLLPCMTERKICTSPLSEVVIMHESLVNLFSSEDGQDIAEYAVMMAVILIIVVSTVRLIGSNSNTVFSQVASSIG
jgi:pilus assembly protein Flp/PilA